MLQNRPGDALGTELTEMTELTVDHVHSWRQARLLKGHEKVKEVMPWRRRMQSL